MAVCGGHCQRAQNDEHLTRLNHEADDYPSWFGTLSVALRLVLDCGRIPLLMPACTPMVVGCRGLWATPLGPPRVSS